MLFFQPPSGNYKNNLQFDGANGVGALAMAELSPLLKEALAVMIFNTGSGRLNYECGSDYVKVKVKSFLISVNRLKNKWRLGHGHYCHF